MYPLIFCLFILIFSGCAKEPAKKLPPPKPKTGEKIPSPPSPEAEKTLSPRREASQRLVQIGQGYLENGEIDKAVQTLQEAINVDYENGIAYFYLSKSLLEKGSYDDALNILDRAENFLSEQESWKTKVEELRTTIKDAKEGKTAEPTPPKQPEGVYY